MVNLFQDEIALSHPMELMTDEGFEADEMALQLVGERHEKRELVNLVRWLILDKSETVQNFIEQSR